MYVVFLDFYALDPNVYRASVVQKSVDEQRSRQRKRKKVDHRKGTRKIHRTVGLVLAEVEPAARRVEHSCDIVRVAEAIIRSLSTNRHICELPGLP